MSDSIHIKGSVTVEVEHDDGRREIMDGGPNLVTTAGLARFAALISQESSAFPSHIAIGTGATAATTADATLDTEVDRNALGSDTSSGAVATYKAFFSKSEANGNTIAEVGLFDQAAGGTMFARRVLASTVVKDATKSLTITWTITLS